MSGQINSGHVLGKRESQFHSRIPGQLLKWVPVLGCVILQNKYNPTSKVSVLVICRFGSGIKSDLINSFITAVFLLIVAILAIQEKERRHLFYIGGALCLTAATVCVIDATLVTKTMRNNLKKALGIKMITSGPLAPEPTPPTRTPTRGGPNAPTRATVKQRSQWQPSSKATSQRNPGGRL
uniref:CKLF like MARVEL transmembrane domain containing 1 n=1 Tax=Bos indicus x Bos taurus TaxID=30522 RepID=A0A4W2CCT8_BOBOX